MVFDQQKFDENLFRKIIKIEIMKGYDIDQKKIPHRKKLVYCLVLKILKFP